ncbi:DUF3868 domain-containing protein [uncultured Desulfovibrio sp.]|uniref:DUF3868 domain-containing protein n=1 Tax=uncultured Desulfovibrio sp. TaxID=167968 RepID=UPI0026269790|nr:DUF3868 domain-containing protein [uncultured Desulfovibrio sp.]
MKKIFVSIALLLPFSAFAQTAYLESVTVENRRVEKDGADVRVRMDLGLDNLDMKLQHTLQLTPVIVSGDGTQEQALQPVHVDGRIRGKVVSRRAALDKDYPAGGERLRRKNGEPQTLHYEATAPYEPWMLNGRLELRADVTGCAECGEGRETMATGGILPYEEPVYEMAVVQQPKEEAVKRRSEVRTARLQYRQDSHNVLPRYKDNQAELDKVQASIDAVKGNTDLTITGIYVTGYASPEATVAYNQALSERRARTFAEYVQQRNPELDKSLWHVEGKGEDWDGLRKVVERYTNLLKQDEVLRIIDQCEGDLDQCEEKIKALVPPEIYQRVLNEMYGPLRRNEYRIEYNVRHFDLAEAKRLLETRPDLLSVAEMQKVADSYGRGTAEYRAVLKVAAETWPDNETALTNYALALMDAGEHDAAIALLAPKAAENGSLQNLMGVAQFKAGRMDKAEEAFREAARLGYPGAAENVRKLEEARQLLGE